MPGRLRRFTRKVTGVTRPSSGTGRKRARSNTFCSSGTVVKSVCLEISRIVLVSTDISTPHDFLGGP